MILCVECASKTGRLALRLRVCCSLYCGLSCCCFARVECHFHDYCNRTNLLLSQHSQRVVPFIAFLHGIQVKQLMWKRVHCSTCTLATNFPVAWHHTTRGPAAHSSTWRILRIWTRYGLGKGSIRTNLQSTVCRLLYCVHDAALLSYDTGVQYTSCASRQRVSFKYFSKCRKFRQKLYGLKVETAALETAITHDVCSCFWVIHGRAI